MSWYYPLSALVNGILSLVFSVYGLSINNKKPLNRVFSLFAFSVALWNIPYFIWQMSDTKETALLWVRVVMMGAILIPVAFFHFVTVFLKLNESKKKEIILVYALSGVFAVSNLTPLYIRDVRQKLFFPYWPDPGYLFHFHIIFFIVCIVYSLSLLVRHYRFLSGTVRNQVRYIFISSIIGFTGGMTNYFLWYDIPIPPFGHCLVALYVVLIGIAIVKYRMLDITIAIRRAAIFTGVYFACFSIPIAVGVFLEPYVYAFFGPRWWIGFFIAGGTLSYMAAIIYNYFKDREDVRIQQEQRQYHAYLRDASSDMVYIRNMKDLRENLVNILHAGLHIARVFLYLSNDEKNAFELQVPHNDSPDKDRTEQLFGKDNPLAALLSEEKRAVFIDDIMAYIDSGKKEYQQVAVLLAHSRIELVVPIFIKSVLTGFILLGEKRKGRHYNEDDVNLLLTFSNQTALAISNIRAQEALMESERKYYDLIQSLPEVIFELDMDGNFTYINDRATELLGFSRQEFLSMNSLDLVVELDRARAKRGFDKTLLGSLSGGREFTLKKKDGTTLAANLYTRNVYHYGEIAGISGLAVDLTEIKKARAALQESEEKFRTMIERSSEMITIVDPVGIIQYQSQSSERIVGYKPDDVMGKDLLEFIHPDDTKSVTHVFTDTLKMSRLHFLIEYRFRHKDGSWRYLESTGTNMANNRLIRGVIINTRDVTQRKDAESIIQKREERYRSLYNNALVAMLTTDLDTRTVITSNDVGHKIFGYEKKGDFIGISFFQLFVDSGERESLFRELKKEGRIYNREIRFKKQDGSVFWAAISQRADPEKEVVETVLVDITKRKIAEQQAHNLTFYDQLTGLANRETLLGHIKSEAMQMSGRNQENIFAVLCLGIDRLTDINTVYGRSAGDRILVEIANVLKNTFSENCLVSRFEGDKFAICFSKMKPQEDFIRGIVKKASDSISTHSFSVDDNIINITASIGVSIYPNDGKDPEEIVKNSEAAMYMAKEQGENSFSLFDTRMYSDMLARIQLERELQDAIDKSEFYAYYQPKVNSGGRIMGVESLIRWKSPRRGMVWPGEFIPLIEKNGMIHDIGAFILRKSLDQARDLREKGHSDLMMAVNLSPIQFSHPEIIRVIEEIIIQSGFDPYRLELEITESSIMKDEQDSIYKLSQLHDMGISIAIDDFGTGYSSLSKLRDYPIDTLKIDKSFVENLPLNRKSAALASSIIDLAHNLGFNVVAEGVETREQIDFLVQHGCDYFQGNYYSKPLPYSELASRVAENRKNHSAGSH